MRLTRTHVYLLLIVLGLLLGNTKPVQAADGTWVGFEPAAQAVPLGSPAALKLAIKDGVNVNAFDMLITYDSNALALSSWSHGSFLSNLSCVHQVIEPGKLALACTQIARPGVYGDGTLLNLSFTTLTSGSHEIVVQKVLLAAPQGDTTTPEKQNGLIIALLAPTYTYTPTRVAALTLTPPIATSTPYFTVTFSPATQVPTFTPYIPPGVTPGNPNTATNIFIATTGIPGEVTSTPTKIQIATASNTAPAVIVDLPSPTLTTQLTTSPTHEPIPPLITPMPTETNPATINMVEGLLWAALGLGSFAIFFMLVIIIRRKTRPQNKEEKDLLL